MGVQTDVVIAHLTDAPAVAATATPTDQWPGLTCNGFDHVQLCTLLSLLRTNDPGLAFDHYLALVQPAAVGGEDGPVVMAVGPDQVAELVALTRLSDESFESVARVWGGTPELVGWSAEDVRGLLRDLGVLAEAALVQRKWLLVWQSL